MRNTVTTLLSMGDLIYLLSRSVFMRVALIDGGEWRTYFVLY